jgi:hypothetical protein
LVGALNLAKLAFVAITVGGNRSLQQECRDRKVQEKSEKRRPAGYLVGPNDFHGGKIAGIGIPAYRAIVLFY